MYGYVEKAGVIGGLLAFGGWIVAVIPVRK